MLVYAQDSNFIASPPPNAQEAHNTTLIAYATAHLEDSLLMHFCKFHERQAQRKNRRQSYKVDWFQLANAILAEVELRVAEQNQLLFMPFDTSSHTYIVRLAHALPVSSAHLYRTRALKKLPGGARRAIRFLELRDVPTNHPHFSLLFTLFARMFPFLEYMKTFSFIPAKNLWQYDDRDALREEAIPELDKILAAYEIFIRQLKEYVKEKELQEKYGATLQDDLIECVDEAYASSIMVLLLKNTLYMKTMTEILLPQNYAPPIKVASILKVSLLMNNRFSLLRLGAKYLSTSEEVPQIAALEGQAQLFPMMASSDSIQRNIASTALNTPFKNKFYLLSSLPSTLEGLSLQEVNSYLVPCESMYSAFLAHINHHLLPWREHLYIISDQAKESQSTNDITFLATENNWGFQQAFLLRHDKFLPAIKIRELKALRNIKMLLLEHYSTADVARIMQQLSL